MTPGILSGKLPLVPLQRVSPSRFQSLKDCALREVWAAGGVPNLLPAAPAARLGSAIHQLLEEAGKAQFKNGGITAIEKRWDELVAQAESAMQSLWLEKQFVPLKTAVLHYEVRRLKAIERAEEITQSSSAISPGAACQPDNACELWVSTRDGLAAGYIDQVEASAAGPILRDYKTGHILEPPSAQGEGAMKETYEVQLKLYAAIYASTAAVWPVKLELVPLQGPVREVPFTTVECMDLLRQAREAITTINAIIEGNPPAKAEALLAAPSPRTCRYCLFRPSCAAYRTAREHAAIQDAWPEDLWGVVRERRALGNGKVLLVLQASAPSPSVSVRGLSPTPDRHPALPALLTGDAAAIFGLKGGGQGGTFQETPWTVIYRLQEGGSAK